MSYDLHTHTLLSDGALLPSELVRRYEQAGYKALAITDHVDASNIEFVCDAVVRACKKLNRKSNIKVIPGLEITHTPKVDLEELVKYGRSHGAKLILVHGETLVEPVIPGTNEKALSLDIDILTHPGLISARLAKVAAKRNIYLELSARRGHSLTNGHVARRALEAGAKLVINSDSHSPEDVLPPQQLGKIAEGAGLNKAQAKQLFVNAKKLIEKVDS